MKQPKIAKEIHALDNRIGRAFMQSEVHQEITRENSRIIRFLNDHRDEDIYQKDLESEFGVTRSTTSRVLGLMEQKGLIIRESVPHDARLKKLSLTQRSIELSDAMTRNSAAMEELLLTGFSEQEKEQLFNYVARMQANLEAADD